MHTSVTSKAQRIKQLLTFDRIPDISDLSKKGEALAYLASGYFPESAEIKRVLIGGPEFPSVLVTYVARALQATLEGVDVLFPVPVDRGQGAVFVATESLLHDIL